MAKKQQTIVRRTRPTVVVSGLSLIVGEAMRAVVDLAHEWQWDLLDLELTRGSLPTDPAPLGAFVTCLPTDPLVARLREMGCSAVRMGRLPHPDDDTLPAVLTDWEAVGRLAAEHFAARAFKHVAFVGRDPWSDFEFMFQAFRDRAADLGCQCHLLRLKSGREKGETHAEMYERRSRIVGGWLSGLPRPVGVFNISDGLAAKVCAMCRAAHLAVPEDVALLGAGNHELVCDMSPVALSSIDISSAEYGRQAAFLLRDLMAGQAAPAGPIMISPARVVERRSTEVLAVGDPTVARAMRFMWDYLDQNLSVDHVAREVGLSRRSLERAFRKELGRGVNAELSRRRLERCCELLRTTDLPIVDLVPLIGFRSSDYLHTAFRREFGTTPRKWRLQERERELAAAER